MGQEICNDHFHKRDFHHFEQALTAEIALLESCFEDGQFSATPPAMGLELEAWLLDSALHPTPNNTTLIKQLQQPLVVPELARFNIEINSTPQLLQEQPFTRLHNELEATWLHATAVAATLNEQLAMIGTLPTIRQSDLCLENMSELQRYHALNEQVMRMRRGQPLEFEFEGREPFQLLHHDVMMEATATSLQIHLQVPYRHSVAAFNHAIRLSAPMVALCANAPYLFGKDLWDDSRIPMFEQAVNVDQLSHRLGDGRVSFGSGYVRESLLELFQENLDHYPVMLPICQPDPPNQFTNLMLHNGTIWRWNRPLVGMDHNGNPHLRIEHRVASAGPTTVDVVANTVFFIGTAMGMLQHPERAAADLPFIQAKENFYRAARYGLDSAIHWNGRKRYLKELIQQELLPLARIGMRYLQLEEREWRPWLTVIEERIGNGQNGTRWQRGWVKKHGWAAESMLADYLQQQNSGNPVHQWIL